ncbi:putative inactive dehydrogenase EasA [Favolaschia claudopus]|uniref:Inactive dehydrogenase EasA n=1 Tax=Favolaschia claudopus TaxID=2862362 RepID=A0AAW0C2R1_9AGAR
MSASAPTSKLFQPIKVGKLALRHRVVLAPMTRLRANAEHVPYLPLVAEYYAQRAHRAGTLLLSEATLIAPRAGGAGHAPGIYTKDQIAAWRQVTDTVHAQGSFIFSQQVALGRVANVAQLQAKDPSFPYVSSGNVALSGRDVAPRALTVPEIKEYAALYAQSAKNAIEAGFDGVEIHGANGYLVHQFLHDEVNNRTDEYGGSVENRARFPLEIVDAVVEAIGAERTAIRLSPWNQIQDMAMRDPIPTFSYVITQLAQRHPDLAYLHLVEPRIVGAFTREEGTVGSHESNDELRAIWAPRQLIRAGGFTRQTALETAEEGDDLIAFGRYFTSNPDLVTRIEKDIPFKPYDRPTFYLAGDSTSRGYTDHPFAS